MSRLSYRTAGESHGPAVLAMIEGMPAGVPVDLDLINGELARRQGGYGRSARQRIEKDKANIISGIRHGLTIGSPLVIELMNRDHRLEEAPTVPNPRPGHADFSGAIKWLTTDCRNVLERASARETAARVAAGAIAKCLLKQLGILVGGYVLQIGRVTAHLDLNAQLSELVFLRDDNEVYSPDPHSADAMMQQISEAKQARDSLGGMIEVCVDGIPPGLGSCMRWQDRLDGRLMQAVGSIQAIKGVEIGAGFAVADKRGTEVHDPIGFEVKQRKTPRLGFTRPTNHAGGLEGGMSNGAPIVIRAAMKPISTVLRGMSTVMLETAEPVQTTYERSDICAVPAASVVAENVVAFEIARACLEKFAGDTLEEVLSAHSYYMEAARKLTTPPPAQTHKPPKP